MTPIWADEADVVPFVAEITGLRADFGNCRTMAVIDKTGRMVAGLIFHNWEPTAGAIEVSAAATSPRWATRAVLKYAFAYCFEHSGCQMVVARISEKNTTARRLWVAFGSVEHVIPRLRGRNEAEVISTLTSEAWADSKFMRQRHG